MKDVVLMAMSTLPTRIEGKNFLCPKSIAGKLFRNCRNLTFTDCRYQLESPVRLILDNSDASEIEFILMCTEKTLQDNDNSLNETAVRYFLQRLFELGYFGEESLEALEEIGRGNSRSVEDKAGRIITFQIVRIMREDAGTSVNPYFDGIGEAVKIIRDNHDVHKDGMRITFIAHGGFRGFYIMLCAVMSILKRDNITPAAILSTDVSRSSIIDEEQSFNMFDFVSGMNEFLTYGSIDMLETYLRNVMTPEEIEQDEILHAMREISDGTKVSEVKKYTEGIQALRRSMSASSRESGSTFRARPEFQIFSDMIRRDYGRLLYEDPDDPYSTINIIERCVAKKMYQQALTFIEAKIPEDYYIHRILYYDDTEENRDIIHSLKEYSSDSDSDEKHVFLYNAVYKKAKSGLQIGNNVYESDCIRFLAKIAPLLKRFLIDPDYTSADIRGLSKQAHDQGLNARFRIKKIVSGAETVVTMVSALPKETVSKFEENQYKIHTIYSKGNVDDQKSQEILRLAKEMCAKVDEMQLEHNFVIRSDLPFSPSDEKLPEILWSACALWVLLKMCRNKLNHGDDRGFTIEELNIVIDVFITYTRYLYDRVNETRGNSSL